MHAYRYARAHDLQSLHDRPFPAKLEVESSVFFSSEREGNLFQEGRGAPW